MSIKKKLIAAAITALIGSSAFAQVSVNSQVAGGVQSYSVANGNSFSTHSATAQANNSSSASGAATTPRTFLGVVTGPYYQASATGATSTGGSTTTSALGIGAGSSSAGASQVGTASSTQAANAIKPAGSFFGIPFGNGGTVGNVNISSLSQVGTQSAAGVTNTGFAFGGTTAGANNTTTANIAAPTSGTSNATGTSTGAATAIAVNFSSNPFLGNNETSSANGTLAVGAVTNIGAFQNGSFGGTITRP